MTDRLTDDEIRRLREAAEKATPGPWSVEGDRFLVSAQPHPDGDGGLPILDTHAGMYELADHGFPLSSTLAFIAAANPQTVLRLLAEVERLQTIATKAVDLGKKQAAEWDRFWSAIDERGDMTVDECIAKWSSLRREAAQARAVHAGQIRAARQTLQRAERRAARAEAVVLAARVASLPYYPNQKALERPPAMDDLAEAVRAYDAAPKDAKPKASEHLSAPRMWCMACGTVTQDGECDCTRVDLGCQRLVPYEAQLQEEARAATERAERAETQAFGLRMTADQWKRAADGRLGERNQMLGRACRAEALIAEVRALVSAERQQHGPSAFTSTLITILTDESSDSQ